MSHDHPIYDDEKRFIIDPVTRIVKLDSVNRPVLIQYDHNSEHITFECARFIEGHDLTLCDKVEVHYNNIGPNNRTNKGVYPVVDLKLNDSDNSKVIFTWIVSQNATFYKGMLAFVVSFYCTNDGDIYYRWNTCINSELTISEGIDNSEAVASNYADVLEMWKMDLFGIEDTAEARMSAFAQRQQDAIANKGLATIASIPTEYADLYSNIDDLNTLLEFTMETPNLYKAREFDENGYYNYSDGAYINDMPDYGSSGFIEVKENIRYYRSVSGYVTFWDADKTFISGVFGTRGFVTPGGCKYINCALLKEQRYQFAVVEFGDVNYKILHSEIDPINEFFSVETNNLYNHQIVGEGCYDLAGNFSYIDDYGSFTIPVTGGESYIKSRSGYVAYFDSANNWINTVIIGGNVNFVIPNDAVKMNVAVLLADRDFWLVRSGETYYKKLISDYLPQTLNGVRYGALGDSITEGLEANTCYGDIMSYSEKLAFVNYGISGNRIADNDDEENDPMYVRYAKMNDDLEIVTVFGGTNDYASQTPIGENSDLTGASFKGAMNILCRGLLRKYTGKRIGFITPIKRSNEILPIKLYEYCNAIKEICGLHGIPVLDLYNTSTITCIDDVNSNGLLVDGLHPSDAGHAVLARKIASFIKTL